MQPLTVPEMALNTESKTETMLSLQAAKLLELSDTLIEISRNDEQSLYCIETAIDANKQTLILRRKLLEVIDAHR